LLPAGARGAGHAALPAPHPAGPGDREARQLGPGPLRRREGRQIGHRGRAQRLARAGERRLVFQGLVANVKTRRSDDGFTLMELLLVLVIVGLLAALVGPTLYQRIKPAKESAARAQIENFMTALDGYFVDIGRYPSSQ